jgi:hypothetical protein
MNTLKVKKVSESEVAKIVAKAMALLAGAFHEPYQHTDWQTGEVSSRNRLLFWQDGVLSGICFQLASKLDYTEAKTIPQAKDRVAAAIRSHRGDEISETKLQSAVEWVQTLQEQAAIGLQALMAAETQYTAATGKTFVYRGTQSANRDIVESPAMLAAKALGIGAQNVAAGYGTDSAGLVVVDRNGNERMAQRIERLPDATGRVKEAAAKQKRNAQARAKRELIAKQAAAASGGNAGVHHRKEVFRDFETLANAMTRDAE